MESIRPPDEQQRDDPSLRADIALYDALIASDLPGKVHFDLNVRQQVDVFAWIPGKGRFAFERRAACTGWRRGSGAISTARIGSARPDPLRPTRPEAEHWPPATPSRTD